MMTNAAGTNVGAWTFDHWGRIIAKTGSAFTRLLYDGEWFESITNQFNLMARAYDPFAGQFMSRDPLDMQTRQTYVYAGDGVVNFLGGI